LSDHKLALVPIEPWAFHSPDIRNAGLLADIGLFAEALIYYDRVLAIPATEKGYGAFIRWFADRGRLDDLVTLINEGAVSFYHYAFLTLPVVKDGVWAISNWQDEEQAKQAVFESRILNHQDVRLALASTKQQRKLRAALDGKIIEVKSTGFGPPIQNAVDDFGNAQRLALVVQAYADATHAIRGGSAAPEIKAEVIGLGGEKRNIKWNISFDDLNKGMQPDAQIREHIPLTALAHANRLIKSASDLGSDLYLNSPMSVLVGDKLAEVSLRSVKIKNTIDTLIQEVEFPNVRQLVNDGKISFGDILALRKRAQRFRSWLQDEADRDRNALIAYHEEIQFEARWMKSGRKVLRLFGSGLSAVAAASGAAAGGVLGGPGAAIVGAAGGQLTGEGLKFLTETAAKMNEDWKPVIFGRWAKERLKAIAE